MVVEAVDGALGKGIQLLHFLTLDILLPQAAQDASQPRLGSLAGDDLGGQGHIVEDVSERARGVWIVLLLIQNIPLDRHEFACILQHVCHGQSPESIQFEIANGTWPSTSCELSPR